MSFLAYDPKVFELQKKVYELEREVHRLRAYEMEVKARVSFSTLARYNDALLPPEMDVDRDALTVKIVGSSDVLRTGERDSHPTGWHVIGRWHGKDGFGYRYFVSDEALVQADDVPRLLMYLLERASAALARRLL